MNGENQRNILNEQAGLARAGRVNNRALVSVRIRGLAFRCASGSRREQILLALKARDERQLDQRLLVIVGSLVLGILGYLALKWLLP